MVEVCILILVNQKSFRMGPKYSNDAMFKDSYDWYCENRELILNQNFSGSHHQSKVKQGVLSIFNKFL